jgi:hypothetical protein
MRLIKKNAPHIKFIISYADGTQCGDGTIYRASNFKLIGIKENKSMIMLPDGSVHCKIIFEPGFNPNGKTKQAVLYGKTGIKSSWTANKFLKDMGAKFIEGFQLKYIYFIHPKEIDNLTVPILPFSKIDEMGAGMYKGKKITVAERKNAVKAQEKCAEPSSSEVAFVTT